MQKRALGVSITVLAVLGGYVWWAERQPEPEVVLDEGEELVFGELAAEDVRTVRLGPEGKTVELARAGEADWVVRSHPDPDRPADDAVAESVAEAVAQLTSLRRLDGADASDPAFELGDSATSVRATLADGREVGFRLGGRPPVGDGQYLAVDGDAQVHLVDPWSLQVLERDPAEFRDRRLLPLDTDAIRRIAITRDGATLELERTERHWFLAAEPGHRASTPQVRSLLIDLVELRAQRYGGAPATLARPDDPTRLRLELTDADGRVAWVELGAEAGPGRRSAEVGGAALPEGVGGEPVEVSDAFLQDLPMDPDSWRAMDLLDFNLWLVDSITWSTGGERWELRKAEDNSWSRTGATPVPLDGERVHDFLGELDGLRAAGFAPDDLEADDAGVEVARITLRQSNGEQVGLALLRGGNRDYVSVDDEPGLREVDADVFEAIGHLRSLEAPAGEQPP